jgi:hypothetical protein
MTSINAIKFNNYSGAMVSDEQRHWNPENMKIYAAEKVKPCVPPALTREYGLVAAYGNTGTSTVGDELKTTIKRRIQEEYDKEFEKLGKKPKEFRTIEQLAFSAFDVITRMKRDHIDQELLGKFGFNSNDFVRGFYVKDGKRIDITDKETIRNVDERITWKGRGEDSKAVFLNAGIFAGYEPKEGFNVFHFSMIEHYCEPVEVIFVAEGSGLDTANLVLADYAGTAG